MQDSRPMLFLPFDIGENKKSDVPKIVDTSDFFGPSGET